MKHRVVIALGSNYLPVAHIEWASGLLASLIENCQFSRRLWTQDIKGSGVWYQNRIAYGFTDIPVNQLQTQLKEIEIESGRTKERITIDFDLMLYDHQRFHEKDWQRPYFTVLFDELPQIAE